jgi:hypothetical protein
MHHDFAAFPVVICLLRLQVLHTMRDGDRLRADGWSLPLLN